MVDTSHSFSLELLALRLEKACPEIRFALVHGSSVGGLVSPESDIDIALFLDRRLDLATYDKILAICQEVAQWEKIDLGVLNDADVVYRFEALKGVLLFSRDQEEYLDFFSLTAREYESQLRSYERQLHHRLRTEDEV